MEISVKERFWRKLHYDLGVITSGDKLLKKKLKEELKEKLKKDGLIKQSTKELGVKGLAIACNILKNGDRK